MRSLCRRPRPSRQRGLHGVVLPVPADRARTSVEAGPDRPLFFGRPFKARREGKEGGRQDPKAVERERARVPKKKGEVDSRFRRFLRFH